jgi:uncharacterized protein YqhQ
MVVSRLLLIPIIAMVGYEILKFGAKYRTNPIVKVLLYPGLLVQMITTKRPTDDMIEVAIASMEEALVADGQQVPVGSEALEHHPMPVLGQATTGATVDPATAHEAATAPEPGEPPALT